MVKISKSEKIANDFLLQLSYAIVFAIVLLFLYNGALFKYGSTIGRGMPTFLWILFGITVVGGLVLLYFWKKKNSKSYRNAAFYTLATSAGMFFIVGIQKIAFFISRLFNSESQPYAFFDWFNNYDRLFRMLFILIGLSVVVELGVYFYRVYKLKKERQNRGKKSGKRI